MAERMSRDVIRNYLAIDPDMDADVMLKKLKAEHNLTAFTRHHIVQERSNYKKMLRKSGKPASGVATLPRFTVPVNGTNANGVHQAPEGKPTAETATGLRQKLLALRSLVRDLGGKSAAKDFIDLLEV